MKMDSFDTGGLEMWVCGPVLPRTTHITSAWQLVMTPCSPFPVCLDLCCPACPFPMAQVEV